MIRRSVRIGALLTVLGLMRLAHAVRVRWRLLLCGGLLTAAGYILRDGPGSVLLMPGFMLLVYTPFMEGSPDADRTRHRELQRELAGFSTHAQRCDLEAALDRYPDPVTSELREILASQASSAGSDEVSYSRSH